MIGLIWGAYETRFNRLLEALLIVTGDDSEPHWRFLDYKRRRKLCRKNVAVNFRNREKLKQYLERILDDSAAIHQKRNAILHGKIAARLKAMPDATMECRLITDARINGKVVQMTFTSDELETLAYDIRRRASATCWSATWIALRSCTSDFCALLESQRKAIELSDIETRLARLEASQGGKQ